MPRILWVCCDILHIYLYIVTAYLGHCVLMYHDTCVYHSSTVNRTHYIIRYLRFYSHEISNLHHVVMIDFARHIAKLCVTPPPPPPPSMPYMSVNWISNGSGNMACRLFGAKPLPDWMLIYCKFDRKKQIYVKCVSKCLHFHFKKWVWKCRMENISHFV